MKQGGTSAQVLAGSSNPPAFGWDDRDPWESAKQQKEVIPSNQGKETIHFFQLAPLIRTHS